MTKLNILYDGPALREHRMEVRDLAPALLAMGELLDVANEVLNGPKTRINVQVAASFKAGSFGVEFEVGSLVQQALQLVGMDGISAKQILEWLGLAGKGAGGVLGLIGLIKWLRGRSIKKVEVLDNGKVRILVDAQAIEVEGKVLELYRNFRIRKALEDVVKPLEREGIDSFAASSDPEQGFEVIEKREAYLFQKPSSVDEMVSNQELVRNLQLVTVAFKDDNKWRFTDGQSSFFAPILDARFVEQINNNTPVSKGDVLKARIRERQWLRGEELRTEYEVLEVMEHRRGGQQIVLPLA